MGGGGGGGLQQVGCSLLVPRYKSSSLRGSNKTQSYSRLSPVHCGVVIKLNPILSKYMYFVLIVIFDFFLAMHFLQLHNGGLSQIIL